MARPKSAPKPMPSPDAMREAIAATGNGVDSGMLLNSLIECWGGAGAFARDIFSEYQQGKPGGLTRQKILEMVSRLTIVVTNQQIARPRKPEDMTDDELAAVAAALLGRIHDHERPPAAPQA